MNILWKIAGAAIVATVVVASCSRFLFAAERKVPMGAVFSERVAMCNLPKQAALAVSLSKGEGMSWLDAEQAIGKTKTGASNCVSTLWQFVYIKKVSEVDVDGKTYAIAKVLVIGFVQGHKRMVMDKPFPQYMSHYMKAVSLGKPVRKRGI